MTNSKMERHGDTARSRSLKRKHPKTTDSEKVCARVGAPSKLSPSQRRKLVRLYFYTEMKVGDICTVLGFGHKKVA